MADTKHTPGPWSFAVYSPKRFGLGQSGDGAFFYLHCVWDDVKNPRARADARLIAAAPCLLAALQAMCDEQNEMQGYVSCATYDKAYAAIAKATGAAS